MDLRAKTEAQIDAWIRNYERARKTSEPFYLELLEERARRAQTTNKLSFDRSLEVLKQAAINQMCISYGDLARASGVEWSKARHQMNGPSGHLDRLLDICHARGLPLLTAICVNQNNIADGELGEDALTGFVAGARRLGLAVHDSVEFHHQCRDECWAWGARESVSQ